MMPSPSNDHQIVAFLDLSPASASFLQQTISNSLTRSNTSIATLSLQALESTVKMPSGLYAIPSRQPNSLNFNKNTPPSTHQPKPNIDIAKLISLQMIQLQLKLLRQRLPRRRCPAPRSTTLSRKKRPDGPRPLRFCRWCLYVSPLITPNTTSRLQLRN